MARGPELATGTQNGSAARGTYVGRVSAGEVARAMVQERVTPLRRWRKRGRQTMVTRAAEVPAAAACMQRCRNGRRLAAPYLLQTNLSPRGDHSVLVHHNLASPSRGACMCLANSRSLQIIPVLRSLQFLRDIISTKASCNQK